MKSEPQKVEVDPMDLAIAKGVEWLDKTQPNWWHEGRIDLNTLNIRNGALCVCGQLRLTDKFGETVGSGNRVWATYGFAVNCVDSYPDLNVAYPALTEKWRQIIQERRRG